MDRRTAADQIIASMQIEGFEYTEEEKQALLFLSPAAYYRRIFDKLPKTAKRPVIAILSCGHNPNRTGKKIPAVGDSVRCEACNSRSKVLDVLR